MQMAELRGAKLKEAPDRERPRILFSRLFPSKVGCSSTGAAGGWPCSPRLIYVHVYVLKFDSFSMFFFSKSHVSDRVSFTHSI